MVGCSWRRWSMCLVSSMWLLRFLSTDEAAIVVSTGLEALERSKPAVKSQTISVIPVTPLLEPEEVEEIWLLAL